MNPRRQRGVLSSPVLVGAVTVLAVIVAVFLAYNANSGLPFVPSYALNVQVANASELTHGAEVHMGGALVGFVDSVMPARVGRSNIDRTWSRSTVAAVLRIGTVAPSA
jgi:ABC-type transporter Mla subunit MlaD